MRNQSLEYHLPKELHPPTPPKIAHLSFVFLFSRTILVRNIVPTVCRLHGCRLPGARLVRGRKGVGQINGLQIPPRKDNKLKIVTTPSNEKADDKTQTNGKPQIPPRKEGKTYRRNIETLNRCALRAERSAQT